MEFQIRHFLHTQGPPHSCRPGVTLNRLVFFFFVTVFLLQGYKKSNARVEVDTEVSNTITFQHHAIMVAGSQSLFSFGWLTLGFVLTAGCAFCCSVGFFLAELKL